MKIKLETKKKAIAYLVKRSTLTREVSLEEMLHFQKYMVIRYYRTPKNICMSSPKKTAFSCQTFSPL